MSWLSNIFKSVESFALPAAAVIAAPFTAGASLALLPEATAIQTGINTVVGNQARATQDKKVQQAAADANAAQTKANNDAINASIQASIAAGTAPPSFTVPSPVGGFVQPATIISQGNTSPTGITPIQYSPGGGIPTIVTQGAVSGQPNFQLYIVIGLVLLGVVLLLKKGHR